MELGAAEPFDEDRLSALPDDVLVHILLLLDNAAAAGRTSVLSRRWRGLWALLPELRFPVDSDPHLVASALAAHEAALRCLHVGTLDAAPEPVEAWLAVAADRLSGRLVFQNRVPGANAGGDGEEGAGERGAFQLPCFANATAVSLDLGFLGLAVPTAGVFGRLIELSLSCVRFQGPCELGDAVSSLRCPGLQKLRVSEASGLANLAIHSGSLLEMFLDRLDGLQQLTVVAPALKKFSLLNCFVDSRPVANISTNQLIWLQWLDVYDPTTVKLGNLAQLQQLVGTIHVYRLHHPLFSNGFLQLLDQFQVIQKLKLMLFYPKDIGISQYVMEDLTKLPRLTILTIFLQRNGHTFAAALFHVLRMCRDLRKLTLLLHNSDLEASYMCPSGCVCDQPTDWKTEELTLNCLQKVAIDMEEADHQVAFVKRLFTWAVVLKKIKIAFHLSISESKVLRPQCHGRAQEDQGRGGRRLPRRPPLEILSRLPAKPLFRFKCVSKGWCHLIADRLGRRKFPQTLDGFFVGGGGGVNDWRFINLSGKSVPLVDASFSFLTKLPGIKQINLLSAHNGLLLFEHLIDCRYEYIVCSPATEQWMPVPGPGVPPHPRKLMEFDCEDGLTSEVNSFLIFDPAVSSHFHLLQFWHSGGNISLLLNVHIFSSETGVWRESTKEWTKWGGLMEFDEVRS
ncbi:unnamed protein product [Miscanthus lutarioriparius]|uniref:F-box domain-containing protein n=1 Tax=Miscanthus lutarioriparius TaxID=422564 RepID=A0A811NEZ7_9POAL|nr:unnamed protein product [Miscanthus lutarioriparius]